MSNINTFVPSLLKIKPPLVVTSLDGSKLFPVATVVEKVLKVPDPSLSCTLKPVIADVPASVGAVNAMLT